MLKRVWWYYCFVFLPIKERVIAVAAEANKRNVKAVRVCSV